MKPKTSKKKQKGIAERKTEVKRRQDIPYKSIGLALLLWLGVTWLFFGHGIVRHIDIGEGQVASSTIEALVDFESENLTETAFNRTKAAGAIPPVFLKEEASMQRAVRLVDTLYTRMEQYAAASTNEQSMIVSSLGDLLLNTSVKPQELIAVTPTNALNSTRTELLESIREVMQTGVLSAEYRNTLFKGDPDRMLSISTGAGGVARTVQQEDLYSKKEAIDEIASRIEDPRQREVIRRLLGSLITTNLTYDEASTDKLRKEAAAAIPPVIQNYPAGTTLIQAGESATPQTLLLLQEHERRRLEEQDLLEQIMEIFGNGVLLLAGLIATAVILRVGNPQIVRQVDKLLLLVILSIFTLGMARLLTYLSVQYALISPALLTYLEPQALAILLAGILLGGNAAIALGFWNSFATAVLFDHSFNVFALGMMITITATSTVRNIHRRSSLFRAGLWVCAVKVLYVLIVAVLNRPVMPVLVGQMFSAILSGMFSTIFTLLLIPVFEKLFKITTDITLLELSDMGHPLLQKMAMQAPGTYHHSLMVATLAQNAAEAVGANSLLVRVCAYYHDIGKMAKPEFFTENIQHKENPHDELSPHMSALVISSHVKEGLTLAKRHKLPQPILDAIEQHHGNGLITYFYHKAKQLQGDGKTTMTDVINESDFRYGGAPAVTPEMAILSLADASEAASRSIEKPTPQKISNLMEDIFAMKIRDGQMDYANLTMAQINVVKQSFIFSLSNMLHGRIPYPKDNENKSPKSPKKAPDTKPAAPKAD